MARKSLCALVGERSGRKLLEHPDPHHLVNKMSRARKTIRLTSYNTRGLPKNSNDLYYRPDILEMLNTSDIVCLQETWYSCQDLACLNELHQEYHGCGVSTVDLGSGLVTGHPAGGAAILWKKDIEGCITPITMDCNWAVAIKFSMKGRHFVIINVYLPYQHCDNTDKYLDCLGFINSFIQDLDTTNFIIIGDWNANLREGSNSLFAPHMLHFCNDQDYIISSKELLPEDSYTFVSDAWGSLSWLDHAVSSQDFHEIIRDITIHYNASDEDHIPFTLLLDAESLPTVIDSNNHVCRLQWDRLHSNDLERYCALTDNALKDIPIPGEVLCKNINCSNRSHADATIKMYEDVLKALNLSGQAVFPNADSRGKFIKPGWADHVQDLYEASRSVFALWRDAGKPRQGYLFDLHKRAKARFKNARRFIKRNENALRRDSLAKKLYDLDPKVFWKEVKAIKNSQTPLPAGIDGINGEENIAEMWRRYFLDIFNCVNSRPFTECELDKQSTFDDLLVKSEEIEEAIKDLDLNKSCGQDGIYAEHLTFSSRRILVLLSWCFTSFLAHGVLPDSMISVILVPIIKDKACKIASKSNYRPIALASVISKVLERVILNRIHDKLATHDNQFGFKKRMGTDHCIFVLKEVISAYKAMNSTVFTCFLDASKAFDRVSHYKLFMKLVSRGVPYYIVRLLVFWYTCQRMSVRWGNVYSSSFTVTNGVRQGGILSPFLFNVYVDDLSANLNARNVGCCVADARLNHIFYADDLVLIAPSSAGLQELLDCCAQYASDYDIKYNTVKSAIMCFRSELLKRATLPSFKLAGNGLGMVDSYKYLGHYLCSDLSDDCDIARQRRQLYIQGNILLRKFYMCSIAVKVRLFKSFCSPMYTTHLWKSYKKCSFNALNVAYHNVLKLQLGFSKYESTSLLCTVFDVPCCKAVIRNLVYRFRQRVDRCENVLVAAFGGSMQYLSGLRRHWLVMLGPIRVP